MGISIDAPCCRNQYVILQSGSCMMAESASGWAELLLKPSLLHSDLELLLYAWMSVYIDLRHTWGPESAQRLVTCRYDLQFPAVEFTREVAKGGLVSSCTKYVQPREEWRTSIPLFMQEIMSWLTAFNQSSSLLKMAKAPLCQGDSIISPGTYLILLLGPLFFVSNCWWNQSICWAYPGSGLVSVAEEQSQDNFLKTIGVERGSLNHFPVETTQLCWFTSVQNDRVFSFAQLFSDCQDCINMRVQ